MQKSPFIGSRLSTPNIANQADVNDDLVDGEDDVEVDHGEGNILAIHYNNHRSGFAYYSSKRNKFFLFEDQPEVAGDLSFIDRIVQQVEPKRILISSRLDSRVKSRLFSAVDQLVSPLAGQKVGNPVNNQQQTSDNQPNHDSNHSSAFGGDGLNKGSRESMEARGASFDIRNGLWSDEPNISDDTDDVLDMDTGKLGDHHSDIIVTVPASDFTPDEALAKVLQLELPDMPLFPDPRQKLMYLSSLFDHSQKTTLLALGALIKDIESSNLMTDGDGQKIMVNGIAPATLENLIYLDCQSKIALQIFAIENHPSVYKQGNSRKEGLSLFALFNRCASRIGSRYLKKLFNQPTNNMQEINDRLDMVEFFHNTPSIVEGLRSCLKGIQDPTSVMEKMRFADCSVNDWAKLLRTAKHVQRVYEYLCSIKARFSIAARFVELFTESRLSLIIDLIEAVIDFRESRATGRFEVNKGLDADLDEMKNLYAQLPDIMFQHGAQEFLRYQDRIPSCQITYATHLGFHCKIPLSPAQMMTGNFKIPGLEFRYRVGESGYYKSPMTRELDATFGDILTEITEKQRKVLLQLQFKVLDGINALDELTTLCAKIDAFIAIAETSRCFKYKRPVFNVNDEMDIEDGRHPLQEIFVDSYIANDCRTGNQSGKIRIITGPNSSGKSIFLKQMALIIYMAHIGSFVPAHYANISLLDRIMTRIKTIESVSTGLSSYILDLKQAAMMTREKTEHSLFVVDELGKGTDPISGISLLSALINYFAKADHVPHVFVATHFLTINEHIIPSPQISFWTLDVKIDNDEVNYQYKLIPGKASSSRATLVIKAAGLAPILLERTEEIENQLRRGNVISARKIDCLQGFSNKLIAVADKFESANFDALDFDGQKFLQELIAPWRNQPQKPLQTPFRTPFSPPRQPRFKTPVPPSVHSSRRSLLGSSRYSSSLSSIHSP
ncbi:mutS protein homolog 5-like [Tetranychus urticae]|uniref:mutS protein homolog 5-like n=1 Tax=Tetranychus urticae TaxID=32264 RepID=UPI00077B8DBB|nr:mutS protein homolog 5-like [Tetranychus urticae]